MPEFGQFALRLGLLLSGYAILVDLVGRRWKRRELRASGRNATIGCLLCLTAACVALEILLARSDFSVRYVAVFFFLVLIFDKDPFGLSVTTPRDGAGLNPLLQHPAMVLHPPALFLGYAAFAIPYAWVFAALRPDDTGQPPILFSLARNGGLFAWMFLTRYGLVSSVHAFPEPGLGILFLVLLIVIWPDHPAFYRRDRAATASGRPLPSVLRPPQISKFLTWTRTAGQRS